MGISIKNAYAAQVPAANTTLYTCPALTQARILKCTVCNDTTTVATITFHKVPSGQAVGNDYLVVNAKAIGPTETYECPEMVGHVLDAGDLINGIASVATQLSVVLDVVEIV